MKIINFFRLYRSKLTLFFILLIFMNQSIGQTHKYKIYAEIGNIKDTINNIDSGTTFPYNYTIPVGYKIDSVLINNILSNTAKDSTTRFTFNAISLNVQFKIFISRIQLIITAIISETNRISDTIYYGDSYRVTYSIPVGYKIDSFLINGFNVMSAKDSTTGYTFYNVTTNQQIYVAISRIQLSITAKVENTLNQNQIYYGDSYRLTYSIPTGYTIDSFILNKVYISSAKDSITGYTLNNIITNDTVVIIFAIKKFYLTALFNIGGSIAPAGITTINYGDSLRYTISTLSGYLLDSLIVDNIKIANVSVYTFKNIDANHTIRAVFKIVQNPCLVAAVTPNIVRNINALTSDITFKSYLWYLNDNKIDSINNLNSYTPPSAGVYTLRGVDINGCYSNFSKKYYYALSCMISNGRLGNAANIQANIIGTNSQEIIVKWCTEIINGEVTIQAVDFSGGIIYNQKIDAGLGKYILNKQQLPSNKYYIQILDSKGELLQISDIIGK